ncbi:MAG: hypothetical protein H0V82_05800 [Candidatus Protochlamydia sp.]|nr:hypothetical protein [Candidatus Protochlamydia sp.]
MNHISSDYHGISELCVIAQNEGIEKPKGNRSLSDINKEYLTKRANEIAQKLMNGGDELQGPGLLAKFAGNNLDKGATQLGVYTGNTLGLTYGAEVSNHAVGFVVRKVMGTMNGKMLDLAIGAAQIAVTPKVLPFLTAFSAATGGIALPVAVGLVSALYNRLLSSGKYTLETLPSPDQLIRYDNEQKCFFDALGEELGEQELKDLQVLVLEYDLICKILASNKDDVANVMLDALDFNSAEFKDLKNYEKEALEKEIKTTTKRLQENNRYARGEGILPGINQLARNFIPLVNSQKVEADQRMHAEEQKMQSLALSLKKISAKMGVPSDADQYCFDEVSKSFFVPSNSLVRWWYSQSAAVTAEKVSAVMKAELLAHCDEIDSMADQINEVTKDGLDTYREQIAVLTDGFCSMHKITAKSADSEKLIQAVEDLFIETKTRLDEIEAKLAAKIM